MATLTKPERTQNEPGQMNIPGTPTDDELSISAWKNQVDREFQTVFLSANKIKSSIDKYIENFSKLSKDADYNNKHNALLVIDKFLAQLKYLEVQTGGYGKINYSSGDPGKKTKPFVRAFAKTNSIYSKENFSRDSMHYRRTLYFTDIEA